MNKFGKENFKIECIESDINNKELLSEREKYWIEFYKSYDQSIGYNLTKGGEGGALVGDALERMKQSRRGQKAKPETIEKRKATFKKIELNVGSKNGVNNPGVKEKISNTIYNY
ncbi:hypothetical protein [uncultured Clostridium sp.]|uniref:hypothetical protein n=1 Tax=uncultured Clostridium sp. TaxID=59620 RepID=UPI0026262EE9|nr:hypothetical protein [uncultured Clostridium sp.]